MAGGTKELEEQGRESALNGNKENILPGRLYGYSTLLTRCQMKSEEGEVYNPARVLPKANGFRSAIQL